MKKNKIKKAVLPVAGLGTRFLPATKAIPKEMLPVLDKPVIQYAIEEAMDAGIEEFIFVTGRGKVMIEDHFDISYELESHLSIKNKVLDIIRKGMPKPGKAFFTRQQHPKGLGHAIYCAKSFLNNEPFIVILPDEFLKSTDMCLKNMIDIYNKTEDIDLLVAVLQVSSDKISKYGVLGGVVNINDHLVSAKSVVEKPKKEEAPSDLAIIGRYILHSNIFDILENQEIGIGDEVQLTDSILGFMNKFNKNLFGYLYRGERYDCGSPIGLMEASLRVGISDVRYKKDIIALLKDIVKDY